MLKKNLLLVCLLVLITLLNGYTTENLLPASNSKLEIIRHNYFTLGYAEEFEQAAWTIHRLDNKMITGKAKRANKFNPDPLVSSESANDADYKNSGYDRGHLIPAADMKFLQSAMQETFFYSNMSPQNQDFNRGIWQDLEEQVRSWAEMENELFIFTGPVLKKGLPKIGANEVAVPEAFYKIVAKFDGKKSKVIAFLIPNRGSDQPYSKFVVPVDKIEQLTGLDFFTILPDNQENVLEKQVDLKGWQFYQQPSKNNQQKMQKAGSQKSQISLKKLNKAIRKLLE